jgi:hypothetical protein
MSCCFYTTPCPLRPPSARVCRLVADAGAHDGGVQLQVRIVQAMTYTQYLFHTFTSSELSPGARVNQEIAQRYHFDVKKLVFSFCPLTEEEQQVPWNICGASTNGAPNLSSTSASASVYNSMTQINVDKSIRLGFGSLWGHKERVSHDIEKTTTKGTVSMQSSVRCPLAAWHDKGIGSGDARHGKGGGGGARLSHCWRNEAHTRVPPGGTCLISEALVNAGFLLKFESPVEGLISASARDENFAPPPNLYDQASFRGRWSCSNLHKKPEKTYVAI